LLKLDFSTFKNAFKDHVIWLDLGYLGVKKLWTSLTTHIPHKLPRKSKNNPAPSFSAEEKSYNQYVGKNRVVVENAISGIKRYGLLSGKFRNKTLEFADEMIELGAGLWNFKVARRLKMNL